MTDQNSQFFAILTAVGEAKQANADALGVPWTFMQMGVGDANGTEPTPSRTQTRLINERRRAPLNQLKVDPANASIVIAEQVIPPDVGGWWIREIGLYDAEGDLVAVANCAPSFKPLLNQGTGKTQVVRMNFIVTSAANVTLKIDPAVVLATREFVELRLSEEIGKLDSKNSVRAATTGPIDLGGLPVLDGIAIRAGDRVLVKDQVQARENGIYIANVGLWQRAADADSIADVTPGLTVTVEQGTKLADTQWKLVSDGPLVLGVDPLVFENVAAGYNGIAPRNVSGPISAAEAGKLIYFYGTTVGQTLTLPSATDLPTGGKLNLQSMAGVPVEISAYGTQKIWVGGSTLSSVTMYPCTELELVRVSGTEWFAQGTGTLHRLNSMPTLPAGAQDGRLASAGFVQQELANERGTAAPLMDGVATVGVSAKKAREDHRHPVDSSRAPVDSPNFTGMPKAPTAGVTATGNQIATLDFVRRQLTDLVGSSPAALDTLNELAAALGNDPNFAATMTNHLSLKAPLESPALTGVPTCKTAPVFSTDTHIANTDWVTRRGVQYSNFFSFTGVVSGTIAHVGGVAHFWHAASAPTANAYSLPNSITNKIPRGATIRVQNWGVYNMTLDRQGVDLMQENIDGAWTATTRIIPPDSYVDCLYVDDNCWLLTGTGVMGKTRPFQASLATNGFQKLPSGLIMQWNRVTVVQQQTVTFALPIVFPNAFLACTAIKGYAIGAAEYSLGADGTVSSISITNTGPNVGMNQGSMYIAIGY
ncbi:phage tail protein [Pseudomonas rubra]|uniref:Phage tail protein n=1 Tax=Pseudomonas rubra TaxID=2942627 RepID=A0ABT5P8Z5_9PSED|nr:phage tail protein [Pseudomonas rubra]MDD1014695.1 phage tail protein [Pseudomonas rubra]MDD1040856.1 phage tail protein [Pseudomonas rubra]MDD1157614.1 phage tail protein [Pseudomonas rubra]